MAERRRLPRTTPPTGRRSPGGRGPSRPVSRGGARGGGSRQGSRRGPSPLVLVMIALPALGIIGFLLYGRFRPSEPEVIRKDNQSAMEKLVAEVTELEVEAREVMALIRSEDPRAREKGEAFRERCERWMDKYDELTQDLRDENGQLREEYAGYNQHRTRVNKIRYDYVKSSGF